MATKGKDKDAQPERVEAGGHVLTENGWVPAALLEQQDGGAK